MPGLSPVVTPGGTAIAPIGSGMANGTYPEPVIPNASPSEMDKALTVSIEAINRTLMRYPNYNPDALTRKETFDAFDKMKNLAAYNYPIRMVKYMTLYREHSVIPAFLSEKEAPDVATYDRAQRAADMCRYVTDNIFDDENDEKQSLRTALWYMLDFIHNGFSALEIQTRMFDTGPYKNMRGIRRLIPRQAKQITFNIDPYSNKLMSLNNWTGYAYQTNIPMNKFLFHTFQPENGLPYGRGYARACYKHVNAINEGLKTWEVGLRRFGTGFLRATTQNGTEEYIKKVTNLLANVAGGADLVIPQGLIVELLNLPGGALDNFAVYLNYHEDKTLQEILGQTLTTTGGDGKGSYALGGIHEGTQKYFVSHPRTELESVMTNQLYRRLVMMNFGPDWLDVVPKHSQGVFDIAERKAVMEFYKGFIESGVVHPMEEIIRKETGMPPLPTTLVDDLALLPERERIQLESSNSGTKPGQAGGD